MNMAKRLKDGIVQTTEARCKFAVIDEIDCVLALLCALLCHEC
jgi:hypothetical protein